MGNGEFDELMARALRSYSAAEPLAGLEERVMARAGGSVPRRNRVWGWAAVLAASVVIFGILILPRGEQKKSVVSRPASVTRVATANKPVMPAAIPVRQARVVRKRLVKHRLSDEEMVLVRFVERDPEAAAKAFDEVRAAVERDITVEPIRVAPIQVESLSLGGA